MRDSDLVTAVTRRELAGIVYRRAIQNKKITVRVVSQPRLRSGSRPPIALVSQATALGIGSKQRCMWVYVARADEAPER